ncbi:MAG TPA: hypothetical protein VL752_05160 [Acidisoma sp.]|uniref:hypothetical protein n=1 Tax=Acidisoma sp. TaxID=1872115 RepID=UPI002C527EB7|nr:hypothetical protein [Acidisoma sp.]HTI00319.1 hypothetical protein [Acidisoma sp.]
MRKTTLLRLAAGAMIALSLGGCYYPYGWHHGPGWHGEPHGPPPPPPPQRYYWH